MKMKKGSERQDNFAVKFDDDTISGDLIYLAELDLLQSYFSDELKELLSGRKI